MFSSLCLLHWDLVNWSTKTYTLLDKMATSMLEKIDKYWGPLGKLNKLLMIEIVLDPRYKLDYVFFFFEFSYNCDMVAYLTKEVKDTFLPLYEFYKKDCLESRQDSNDSQTMTAPINEPINQVEEAMQSEDEDASLNNQKRVKSLFKKQEKETAAKSSRNKE